MAKPENVRDDNGLLGGLSFDASKRAAQETAAPATPAAEAVKALSRGYKSEKAEKRNVKLNVLIKPSTAKLLDKAVLRKEIKSKNDIVNYLLEQYFGL